MEGMKWASEWFRAPGRTVIYTWLKLCCAWQTPQTSERQQDKFKCIRSNSSFHPRGLEKNLPKVGGGLEKLQLCPGPVSSLMQSSLSLVRTKHRRQCSSLPSLQILLKNSTKPAGPSATTEEGLCSFLAENQGRVWSRIQISWFSLLFSEQVRSLVAGI